MLIHHRFDVASTFTSVVQQTWETKLSGILSVIRSERIAIAVKRERDDDEKKMNEKEQRRTRESSTAMAQLAMRKLAI